jgi:hypothetical protein
MLGKNKGAKKRTSKAEGVEGVAGTETRKAVIRQAKAKAKELCELGYNTVYYSRSACRVRGVEDIVRARKTKAKRVYRLVRRPEVVSS